jgi:hypothetical protein
VWKPKWLVASVAICLLAVTSCSSGATPEDAVTIYGDGDIGCPEHRADGQSLPVGWVVYQPGEGEIRVIVTLTDAAPNAPYYVEVWIEESCEQGVPFKAADSPREFETNENGEGAIDFALTGLASRTFRLNVNLCCGTADLDVPPEDPRHREMGTAQFTEVVVP